MKAFIVITTIALLCTGCARPQQGSEANYNFKGNLNHQNGDDCWYRCR